MRFAVPPAVFFGSAVLLCGLMLWLRQSPPVEASAAGGRPAREQRTETELGTAVLERYVGTYEGTAA
jgi:hypothetical protein